MANIIKSHITFVGFLLFISLFHSHNNSLVSARDTHHHHHRRHLSAEKPLHSPVTSSCASIPLPQGGLKISHRFGPCSPLGQQQQGIHHNSTSKASQSQPDQYSINSPPYTAVNSALDSSDHGEGIAVPVFNRSQGAGNYLVTIGLGTPKQDLNLMFDTGSELSWVKCQPGGGGGFDPNASSTYDDNCGPSCNYFMNYLDGSSSSGYYVKDKLTISGTDEFSGFVFGCSQHNSPDFGQAAGVLALGQSNPVSLLSKTADFYGDFFCYCLPTRDSSAGYLLFGKGALEQCQSSQSTALVNNPNSPNHYFVDFGGITIGRVRVNFPASSSSSPGTIIDSGTTITHLPAAVYKVMKLVFEKSMGDSYPVAPPSGGLDSCYDMQGNFDAAVIPEVVLHFEDMDLSLGPSAVVWAEDGVGQVCLAFAAKKKEDDLTIVGNHQQRGLNVLYNLQGKTVEFGPGSCG